ncbi:hypothetical protein VP01_3533g1 [Puccinia sorghi]|uniref:Uncharacterized protein n=1 Tax=Puccinia sorghi TaxID=27349 RepID=A0A0L6UXG2_9BASI|nr:hypothetical protein VP01_3533g1 [Puccinia sorghi]
MSISASTASRTHSGCSAAHGAADYCTPTKQTDEGARKVLNPSGSPDDYSRPTYVRLNLIRCLKAVWPSREKKAAPAIVGNNNKKHSKLPSPRVLERQLKLQQERIRCDWRSMDRFPTAWRPNRPFDSYYRPLHPELVDHHLQPAQNYIIPPLSPLDSIHPSPTLQAAK